LNDRFRKSPIVRLAFQITAFYFGILIPIVCLATASGGGLAQNSDRWQSGELKIYALLLLEMPETLPVIPLMLMSMGALASFEVRPKTSQFIVVRMAIYFGALISFQYLWYSMVASVFWLVLICGILIWPAVFAIALLFAWCFRKLLRIMILTAAIAVLLSLGINLPNDFNFVSYLGFLLLVGSALGGPFGCFITYSLAARRIYLDSSPYQSSLPSPVGWGTSCMVWFTATSVSIILMLDKYSKLPLTQPSSCFVCSAAAYGHKQIVASEPVVILGQIHLINRQLQRLKFLEIALIVVFPFLHRRIRIVYNKIGPILARPARCNRWYADICFFSLKPLEWFALSVQTIIRVPQSKIDSIYAPKANDED